MKFGFKSYVHAVLLITASFILIFRLSLVLPSTVSLSFGTTWHNTNITERINSAGHANLFGRANLAERSYSTARSTSSTTTNATKETIPGTIATGTTSTISSTTIKASNLIASPSVPHFPFETATPVSLAGRGNPWRLARLSAFHAHFISSYISWHKITRANYEAGHRAHIASNGTLPRPTYPPALIYETDRYSFERGLGDRFRGLAAAYLIAALSRRLLLISWDQPVPLAVAFALHGGGGANFTYDNHLFEPGENAGQRRVLRINTRFVDELHERHVNETVLRYYGCDKMDYRRVFAHPPTPEPDVLAHPTETDVAGATAIRMQLSEREANMSAEGVGDEVVDNEADVPPCMFLPLVFKALLRPTDALRDRFAKLLESDSMRAAADMNREPNSGGVRLFSVHARLGQLDSETRPLNHRFRLPAYRKGMDDVANCMVTVLGRVMSTEFGINTTDFTRNGKTAVSSNSTEIPVTAVTESPTGTNDTTSPSVPSLVRTNRSVSGCASDVVVFLATDSVTFRPALAGQLPSLCGDRSRLAYADLEVVHAATLEEGMENREMRFLDTFFDLYMLSRAEGIAHMPSGFADLGAFWGGVCNRKEFSLHGCMRGAV